MMEQDRSRGLDGSGQPYHGPAAPPPRPPARSGGGFFRGCLIAVFVVGILGFLAVLGIILLVALGTAAQLPGGGGGSGAYQFQEVTLAGRPGDPKIVCISIEGVISGGGVPGVDGGLASLTVAKLRRAKDDDGVRGVILYVNSPGGGITASDILHREVERLCKGSGGKPVVACMMDVAASGGYYVSVAADYIVAHPTTITGSIGVLMPMYDATALLRKIGVRDETITTGEFKDIGSPFKEKTAEQKESERRLLESVLVQMHERFLTVVAEGRSLEPEQIRPLADGRIFTSADALKHGLIDEIGYESDAIAAVKRLAKVPSAHLVQYRREISLVDVLGAFVEGPRLTLSFGESLPGPASARPMFLWTPPTLEEQH